MSFCWTRHRISLTNAEVAHNASLLLDKVTFHSSNAFLRSVFRSARLNTQKKKLGKFSRFFLFLSFFGSRFMSAGQEKTRRGKHHPLRAKEKRWGTLPKVGAAFRCFISFQALSLACSVERSPLTSRARPRLHHPSFHNYMFWTSVSISL